MESASYSSARVARNGKRLYATRAYIYEISEPSKPFYSLLGFVNFISMIDLKLASFDLKLGDCAPANLVTSSELVAVSKLCPISTLQ